MTPRHRTSTPTESRVYWILIFVLVFGLALYGYLENDLRISPNYYWQKATLEKQNIDTLPVYVISLARSKERYKKIHESLKDNAIKDQLFVAVDGYDLKITDENNVTFTGQDLKNGKYDLLRNKKYTIHSKRVF